MKFLIVGLGNIGSEYANTRHNIGFLVVEKLANELSCSFATNRLADTAEGTYKGKKLFLVKPNTYMNLSGKAVKYYLDTLQISKENLLIIVDDLAIPFTTLRLKSSGSHAGHNGLRNIEEELKSNIYSRLRVGIGSNFEKGRQVDFVLGKWNEEEIQKLPELIQRATDACKSYCFAGLVNTMNTYNK